MYFFRKRDALRPDNINIRIMHVVNVVAVTVFLLGIIWKIIDWFLLK